MYIQSAEILGTTDTTLVTLHSSDEEIIERGGCLTLKELIIKTEKWCDKFEQDFIERRYLSSQAERREAMGW